jgi:hypothetical protein
MNDANDPSTRRMPIRDLKMEEGAEDLLSSPAMEPYMDLVLAMAAGQDLEAAVQEIAALPLEGRYVWRVASALKWAFADFESVSVVADRKTLSPEDRQKLADLLRVRPIQFCMFLAALFGEKQMELLMASAIRQCRQLASRSVTAET